MAAIFALSRFVEDVRVIVPTGPVEWLPDGRTTLFLRVVEGGRGDLSVAGPRTRAMFKTSTGVERVVAVVFKPGWSPSLLGVPANELTDRIVMLEDLWGRAGRDLCRELLGARGLAEILDGISRALAVRGTFESASASLARRAVRLLEGHEVRVSRVASQLGVTERHLRRVFTENIGIGPKDFARSVRLRRSVRMSETSTDWVRIAVEAGYYDQAHLITDFRDLIGLTPGAYVKRSA